MSSFASRLRNEWKLPAIIAGGIALVYLGLSWALFSTWQSEMRAYLDAPASNEALKTDTFGVLAGAPQIPPLLKILMLPLPSAIGPGGLWPFVVQALFIAAFMFAFLLRPIIGTMVAFGFAHFALVAVFKGSLFAGIAITLFSGIPFICILSLIGMVITRNVLTRPSD